MWSADHHLLAYHPTDGILYIGSDGGLDAINMAVQPSPVHGCKATQPTPLDCNISFNCWTSRNDGFATDLFYNVAVSDAWNFSAGISGGLQNSGTKARLSSNNNSDWRSIGGGDGGANALDFEDADVAYVRAYPWCCGAAARLGDLFSSANPGISDSSSIGIVRSIGSDRFQPGILFAVLDDGHLYYATDARTAAPGTLASWRCLDPTPADKADIVTSLEFVRGSGQYLVATVSQNGEGAIYLVKMGTRNAPGPCSSATPVDVTTGNSSRPMAGHACLLLL